MPTRLNGNHCAVSNVRRHHLANADKEVRTLCSRASLMFDLLNNNNNPRPECLCKRVATTTIRFRLYFDESIDFQSNTTGPQLDFYPTSDCHVSEMTYTVSSGTLNSSIPYLPHKTLTCQFSSSNGRTAAELQSNSGRMKR